MQIEAWYDLDRKAAKISALSPNNLGKYEYLPGEDLGLKPSTIEQAKFEYSPLCKISKRGLNENDKKEGLLMTLKNIENTQKNLINDHNKNKPEKTARELYQDGIEGMKSLKVPGEIESKDEKSQMYLENNLNKIKNYFSDIYDKYHRFFKYIANKEKNDVDHNKN